MKKSIARILACTLLLSLTGCANAEPKLQETAAPAAQQQVIPEHISFSAFEGGQALTIEATADLPEQIPQDYLVLGYDQEAGDRLFKELVPDPEKLAHPDEEGRIVGIHFETNNEWDSPGYLYFENHDMTDWDEHNLDGHYDSYYITDKKPGNYQKSAQEVLTELATHLEDYSCLQFTPVHAAAVEGSTGAYYWRMAPSFEGIPIHGNDFGFLGGQIRETGQELIRGNLLLKIADRPQMEDPLSFTEALDRLKAEWAQYTYAKSICIDRILFCYMAIPEQDHWILSPAWVFQGDQSKECVSPYEERHNGDHSRINYIYEIRDGFLDVSEFNSEFSDF